MTLAPKFGSSGRNTKIKLKIMSLEVDSAYHTECIMKAIRNRYGLLCAAALLVLFVFHKKPIIKLRSIRAQAVYLPTNVRDPISYHRGGSVGVPSACPALCGLLCWTLWARPEYANEALGEQTLLHRKTLSSCTAAAVVVDFAPLSYHY